MIASLRGILTYKSTNHIIVEVQGTGYGVSVPLSTFYQLPETGETVFLNIHTYVKEDLISLFGFITVEEKRIFQSMISVSGIGPRLALNILSGMTPEDLTSAISSKNTGRLTSLPGVGPKMADRLIFEMKDKIGAAAASTPARLMQEENSLTEDALSALTNLGYKEAAAQKAVDRVCKGCKDALSLKEILTESLKLLSK